jgi:Tol biopolymer transport system component
MELLSPLELDRLKLYVFDFESNEFIQIPDLVGACYRANWAADGKQLLLTCETETSIDVFAFSLQAGWGHRLTDCTEEDALSCVYPAQSPDGKWIAYYKDSVRSGVSEIQGLYFLDGACVDDEPVSCESVDIGPFDAFWPYTWSPDGLYLAGLEHSTQTSFIRIFRIQDGVISHLRDIQTEDHVDSISWSPDGEWIAYSTGRKIYIVSPDGEETIYLHEANGANIIGWIAISPSQE